MSDFNIDRPIIGEITPLTNGDIAQESATEFLKAIDALLALPGVEAIRWRQYTPFFNDGEQCVFSVDDWFVKLSGMSSEESECGDGLYWCRCADPRPDTLRHQRVPCGDAFCATCWEAGER